MKVIAISAFKAGCLAMLEAVARTGESFVVTKRGKALVRVVPTSTAGGRYPQDELVGTVEVVGDVVAPAVPPETWDAWEAAQRIQVARSRRGRRRPPAPR
jgi:antitoxin (DNA-binding transcriptional repressor) of toxin-antitoxin stability system